MSFILGLCLGSLLIYLLLSPRIRKVVAINTETQLHNEELEEKKKALDGCVIAAEKQLQLIEEKKQGLISQKENLENNGKNVKEKIIPAYQRKDEPKNKKVKKKPDKKVIKSRITIAIIIFAVVLVGLAIFGIVSLVNNNKYKPYRKYEETMKVYGFDKMYDNNSADTGESVTKSEAVKIILSCVLNTSDITDFLVESNKEYTNADWVDYARYRGIIGSADINKDNADDKATYIEVIRYLANAKTKILEKELNSKSDLKVKDINKYKNRLRAV